MAKKSGYDLSRTWFNFAFEKEEAKAIHTAIFMWIVELNNRLGWKQEFGLPTQDTMEGLSIGNKTTYLSAIKDLTEWKFIEIVKESKNQYQSMIIKICHSNNVTARGTALDTALQRHRPRHSNGIESGIGVSTVPIDKPRNQETKKPQTYKPETFDLPFSSVEFVTAWNDYLEHRQDIKKPATTKALDLILSKCKKWGETKAIAAIEKTIENRWTGLFEPNEKDMQSSQNGKNGFEHLQGYRPDLHGKQGWKYALSPTGNSITYDRL